MGPYMRPMALNVPLAMLASMLVSFAITPWVSSKLLRDDDALTALLAEYPQADSQRLRTLIREGRKELAANTALRPGQEPQRKHYRALFQALRQLQDPDEQP